MSHSRIRKIFSNALLSYTETTNLPVYFDNVPVCDKSGTPLPEGEYPTEYILAHLIPADTFSDTLSGDHTGFIGIFQMTIVTEYGTGCLLSEDIIDALQDTFRINELFADVSGFTVQVTSPIKTNEGRVKNKGAQWQQHAWFDYRSDKETSVAHLIRN